MLGFGEKRILTIDEMNAYRTAYGNPLLRKEIFTSLAIPFMVGFFSVMILFYYWWLALIAGIVCAIYGYTVLMPDSLERVYHQQARIQRNRFMNNISQLLSNDKETIFKALQWCAQDVVSEGEFQQDLKLLLGDLIDATPKEVHNAFTKVAKKYKSDFIFSLFMENLSIAYLEGRTDTEKLKDLKSWHNKLLEETNEYMQSKMSSLKQYKMTLAYTVIIVGVLTFSFGFDGFLLYYAHNWIGWIFSIILLSFQAYYFHSFHKKFMDDELMEVTIWKK